MTAGERREEILTAAVAEFAVKGLHGTSTETIAARASVSQPYLFRLFGTKKDLFLAAVDRGFDHVQQAFAAAAEADPDHALEAMGEAYHRLLGGREELLLQMQAYAACDDRDVQALVRRRYAALYRFVEHVSRAPAPAVQQFFAFGMLMNVAAAMDLPSVLDTEDWAQRCLATVEISDAPGSTGAAVTALGREIPPVVSAQRNPLRDCAEKEA